MPGSSRNRFKEFILSLRGDSFKQSNRSSSPSSSPSSNVSPKEKSGCFKFSPRSDRVASKSGHVDESDEYIDNNSPKESDVGFPTEKILKQILKDTSNRGPGFLLI
jgi:hypothetical protein